jgi:hypothetical protein
MHDHRTGARRYRRAVLAVTLAAAVAAGGCDSAPDSGSPTAPPRQAAPRPSAGASSQPPLTPKERGRLQRELQALRAQDERERRWAAGQNGDSARVTDRAKAKVLPALRSARLEDYSRWLLQYMRQGGRPDVVLPSDFSPGDTWYVAKRDFVLEAPLYGAAAIRIIVGPGVTGTAPNGLGHSTLYEWTKLGKVMMVGDPSVPLYADVSFTGP